MSLWKLRLVIFIVWALTTSVLLVGCKGEEARYVDGLKSETGERYEKAMDYAKACDEGGMTACVSLAELFRMGGDRIPRDEKRAAHLVVKACGGKHEEGCRIAKQILSKWEMDEDDLSALLAIAEAGCEGNDEAWCSCLAERVESGLLKPRADLHCRHTAWCSEMGLCSLRGDECGAKSDAECAMAEVCRSSGLCSAVGGRCLATKDTECENSDLCRFSGLCSASNGSCVAGEDSECSASEDCNNEARCWAKDGECYDRDLHCKQSQQCMADGLCTSDDQGNCFAGSSGSCRMSRGCSGDGRCTASGGRCVAASSSDCRPSNACKYKGRCEAQDGQCFRPDLIDADCAAHSEYYHKAKNGRCCSTKPAKCCLPHANYECGGAKSAGVTKPCSPSNTADSCCDDTGVSCILDPLVRVPR